MALNTHNKRRSAIGCGLLWRTCYARPDGTIGDPDRRQAAACYRFGVAEQVGGGGTPAPNPYGILVLVDQPLAILMPVDQPIGILVE